MTNARPGRNEAREQAHDYGLLDGFKGRERDPRYAVPMYPATADKLHWLLELGNFYELGYQAGARWRPHLLVRELGAGDEASLRASA